MLGQHLRGAYATRAWGMKVAHVLGWIEPSDSMIGSACIVGGRSGGKLSLMGRERRSKADITLAE